MSESLKKPRRGGGSVSDVNRLMVRLWKHLSRRRHKQLILLLGLTLLSAFAEVLTIGAVIPFIGVLVSPESALQRPIVANVAQWFGISSGDELALALTVAFALTAVLAGAVRLLVLWTSTRLSFAIGIDLGMAVYVRTLYQPFRIHAQKNSSAIISISSNKVSTVVNGAVLPALVLLSQALMLVGVIATLVAIDPQVAIYSALGLGVSYLAISRFSRRQLRLNATRIAEGQVNVLKTAREALGGIRNVILDGTQPYYTGIFSKADRSLRAAQGSNTFISASPRFAMEALGMTVLAVLAYGVSQQRGGVGAALPVLGALALGAQRLIPAMQSCFASWSSIVGSDASLFQMLDMLDQPLPPEAIHPTTERIDLYTSIRFENVRFRYSADSPWVLDGVSFTIPKGARVGFVGPTGSGKSTVLDLLMGLLEPTEGRILVDDRPITGARVRQWQHNVAHVPQSIYLTDASVAENIAFGIQPDLIDMAQVVEVARQAQIASFIEENPEGYRSVVGERGVRLSGGQRQRIGIARALYRQGTVLVFDEATSALDSVTESAVMESIENLDRDLTILLIAHRLTTVRRCDILIELDRGRVVAQGTYDELLVESDSFNAMATTVVQN